MTHKEIFTKFMIEYDKANVTSSYPSFTEYEVATFLDKAYLSIITQKLIGNVPRRAGLEMDIKAMEDLEPLIKQHQISDLEVQLHAIISNVKEVIISNSLRCLYFIDLYLNTVSSTTPMDGLSNRMVPVKLVSHITALKFFSSAYNLPWIKTPVAYMEDNKLFVVTDPINSQDPVGGILVYIQSPNTFVKQELASGATMFDPGENGTPEEYEFELNDAVAEELISLAISYALENIESPRINTHVGMRGLES